MLYGGLNYDIKDKFMCANLSLLPFEIFLKKDAHKVNLHPQLWRDTCWIHAYIF